MKWKKFVCYSGGILLIAVIANMIHDMAIYRENGRIVDEKRIEADLRSNLPVGTPHEEINRYLTEIGLIYRDVPEKRAVHASTDNLTMGGIIKKRVGIQILLDDEQRLKTIDVITYYDGS